MKQYVYYVVYKTWSGVGVFDITLEKEINSCDDINNLSEKANEICGRTDSVIRDWKLLRVEGEEEEKKEKYELAKEAYYEFWRDPDVAETFPDWCNKKINRR